MSKKKERLIDAAVVENERLVDDYDSSPGEILGAALEAWFSQSRKVAGIKQRIMAKHLLARGIKKQEAEGLLKEADKITLQELTPALDELEVFTQHMVDILAENEGVRKQIQNWLAMTPALRKMLKKGLYQRGISLNGIVEQAEEIEAERQSRT